MELTGYSASLAQASWTTVQLAFVSLCVGLILAVLFACGEMSRHKWLAWPTTLFITIIRGLPELLVVLFIFFGSTQVIFLITGNFVDISPFISGVIALALIFASYASQTIRGALKAVPSGHVEAANALGLSRSRTFIKIVLPQAVRHAMPGLMNQWLVLLKDTALVSLIGVTDLMKQAQLASATTHQAFTWYATAAAIYLIITIITQKIVKIIDARFSLQEASTSAGTKA
ncbi:arginine ABC transporter permease ArtQ [Vibrio ezurae]|uniref:Arginine ABC transporter permease protein ArtQ n=1 Tax=Vibrio ezurae NBRC 102218 TaxID=1219080 RepID=U3AZ95_9VIBR|nr:arginine ABC transporter permease ArtQ [Vibrio ezurae]GAD79065.1 arginine ABC transporter permease protein ArtQ [Vibrio ezurae NBRC 102218]